MAKKQKKIKRDPAWDREMMAKGYIKIYHVPDYKPGMELTDDMRAICGLCGDFLDNGKEHSRTTCLVNA